MRFDHFLPCNALKPFISTFAIQETNEENTYRVLPGNGLVIGFQYKGKLKIIHEQDEQSLATSGITGIFDQYRTFKNSADIGTVLVYFKETGASSFFRQPLHELFRESISLENFFLRSELLVVEDQLREALTDDQRISSVEKFLLSKLNPTHPDKLVTAALALIHRAKGNVRISELAAQLNISQSPLEKRFRQHVGTTTKKFASIIRMKHLIQKLPDQSLADLSYEAGFYDQAHFIKEFKTFTGETPTSFLASRKT